MRKEKVKELLSVVVKALDHMKEVYKLLCFTESAKKVDNNTIIKSWHEVWWKVNGNIKTGIVLTMEDTYHKK